MTNEQEDELKVERMNEGRTDGRTKDDEQTDERPDERTFTIYSHDDLIRPFNSVEAMSNGRFNVPQSLSSW